MIYKLFRINWIVNLGLLREIKIQNRLPTRSIIVELDKLRINYDEFVKSLNMDSKMVIECLCNKAWKVRTNDNLKCIAYYPLACE